MSYESDWQAADSYTYLEILGSTAFAWEFLRRNTAYRTAYYRYIAGKGDVSPEMSELIAQQWGMHFAVDPDLRADRAPVVWLAHLNPATVIVAPAPDEFTDARSISKLTPAFSRRTTTGEHWLLDQEGDALPVALIYGADTVRPAAVVIPLDSSFPTRIGSAFRLRRAMTDGAPGRAPGSLTAQQRKRLPLILRALDGRLAGWSYRAIAEVLFGGAPTGCEWKTHEMRGRTLRLCRRGFDLMHGEYLNLLRYPRQFRA